MEKKSAPKVQKSNKKIPLLLHKWIQFSLVAAPFFGLGLLSKKAPGTVGTLGGVFLFFILAGLPPLLYMSIVLCLTILGLVICETYEQQTGLHDQPEVVWDEVVGILITMTWVPLTLKSLIIGFILFRILDIWKPWIIGLADKKIPGGVGVMTDDILAGIAANVMMQLLLHYHPTWMT